MVAAKIGKSGVNTTLKNPPGPGQVDYFDQLPSRIRDIRASERRVYLRVRELLSLAADYSSKDKETHAFFQVVQNKLHFAATGKTAPELIAERANADLPNMGLTTWKGGAVRKHDVTVAKNSLRPEEIDELNRISSCSSTSPRTRRAGASRSSCAIGASDSTTSCASHACPSSSASRWTSRRSCASSSISTPRR